MTNIISDGYVILFTTPIFLIAIAIEWYLSYKHDKKSAYKMNSTVENLYSFITFSIIDLLYKATGLSLLLFVYQFKIYELEVSIIYWVLLFLGIDFLYWCMHSMSHNSRFFWATHSVHHSSKDYNLSVTLRSDLLVAFTKFIYFSPLAILGFRPIDILSVYLISQIYSTFMHTKHTRRNKWLEYIFITPSLHRVHHSSKIEHLDRNMGRVLSVWDRLFGTFEPEKKSATEFGTLKSDNGIFPFTIFSHELKQIVIDIKKTDSIRTKMRYIFGKPGWSHDGSSKTTIQLRNEITHGHTRNNRDI